MEKGLGIEGESVKEDLTNAGDSYPGFGGEKADTGSSGVGVEGDKGGEEATTKPESQDLSFGTSDGEKADEKGFGGGPENPPSEVKDISEAPIDVEVSDVSYHNGPVLEDDIRGPSAGGKGSQGGKGEVHDLKKDTFKWTKVQDRIILDKKKVN